MRSPQTSAMYNLRFKTLVFALMAFVALMPAAMAKKVESIACPDVAAAEAGSGADAFLLAKSYEHGYCGVVQSTQDADHWYRQAAEQGNEIAAYWLGERYFTGYGLPAPDYPEAKKWYAIAAEKGHGLSQLRMGFLNAEGHFDGLTTDYEQAEHWFMKAAEQGAGDARFRLGNFYLNYKSPPEYIKGHDWLQKAAQDGHRVAMFDLARMYLQGKGIPALPAQGMGWLEKAAQADLLQAQMTLVEIYTDGLYGQPQDHRKALGWILKIATKPTASPVYLNKAADIFFEGLNGAPKNYPTALKFYERAANKGDAHAKARLFEIYSKGLGVPADPAKAKTYADVPVENTP